MDGLAYWLLVGVVILGVELVASLVIARFAGSNERGNDDHELQEPPE